MSKLRTVMNTGLALALSTMSLGQMVHAAEGPSLHAFIEPALKMKHKFKHSTGFTLADSALYLDHRMGGAKFFVDLPFSSAGSPTMGDFSFAAQKAQAYVNYQFNDEFDITLGQIDGIFGFERSDGPERTFVSEGRVAQEMVPTVHAGLVMTYAMSGFKFQGYVANPGNGGVLNSATTTGRSPDFGVNAGWKNDVLRISAGYRYFRPGLAEKDWLFSTMAGFTWGNLETDLEFDIRKAPGSTSGSGFMAHMVYTFNSWLAMGLRPEYVRNMTHNQEIQITFGPQFKVTNALKFKVDYDYNHTKTRAAGSVDSHALALAMLYTI